MFYALAKILQELSHPFSISLALLAFSVWRLRVAKPRQAKWAIVASFLILFVTGMPLVADGLLGALERSEPTLPTEEYPSCDAIVVLGGTTGATLPPRREPEELWGSRLLPTSRLFHAGKATWILVSGGGGYEIPDGGVRSQAEDMREILMDLGVPADAVVDEGLSRNTDENASRSARILRERRVHSILLVTSAFHQMRAKALFEREGFVVTPVPTGHMVAKRPWSIWDFIPTAAGVERTTIAMKEVLGYYAYWMMGKL